MEQKQTTFPHFIKVTGIDEVPEEFWVNANLIQTIDPVTNDKTSSPEKSILWFIGDKEACYVRESPREILERIYDDPNWIMREEATRPDES